MNRPDLALRTKRIVEPLVAPHHSQHIDKGLYFQVLLIFTGCPEAPPPIHLIHMSACKPFANLPLEEQNKQAQVPCVTISPSLVGVLAPSNNRISTENKSCADKHDEGSTVCAVRHRWRRETCRLVMHIDSDAISSFSPFDLLASPLWRKEKSSVGWSEIFGYHRSIWWVERSYCRLNRIVKSLCIIFAKQGNGKKINRGRHDFCKEESWHLEKREYREYIRTWDNFYMGIGTDYLARTKERWSLTVSDEEEPDWCGVESMGLGDQT